MILGGLHGHLEYDGQALLNRASVLATAAAGLVAHQLVNDPGGDAGVLQPGREGMAEIVSVM